MRHMPQLICQQFWRTSSVGWLGNGTNSVSRAIHYGLPQSPNLGPLQFLIYISDFPNVSTRLIFILVTDDTNAFYSHTSEDTIFQIVGLNTELAFVAEGFRDNRLTIKL